MSIRLTSDNIYVTKITNMKDKIVLETVETIIDNLEEKLVDYMFKYGEYSETNDKFYSDKEELTNLVIKELNSRLRESE